MLMYNNDNNASLSLRVAFNALKTVFERVKAIVEVEAAERAAEKSQKKRIAASIQRGSGFKNPLSFIFPKRIISSIQYVSILLIWQLKAHNK